MNYTETIEYMFGQLPMFHRVGKIAYKNNLDNALLLDKLCDYPHRKYKTIHVAGTNGKGSVSHLLAAVLQTAGYKTGLFTSPHLRDFRERIKVNGEMVSEMAVSKFITDFQFIFDEIKPSFFEMTSAFAFQHFANENVDIAIVEVGMGGRLDSTNIILPLVSVITNIGLDHVEYLGDTLEKIASEKAGIIKENTPVVIGEFHPDTFPVFENISKTKKAKLKVADKIFNAAVNNQPIPSFCVLKNNTTIYQSLQIDLHGLYQQKNICTVLATIDCLLQYGLKIDSNAIITGLANASKITGLMGRWQIIGSTPTIICDTGHNVDGIKWVVKQLQQQSFQKLHFVIGMVSDKDISAVLGLLPKDAIYYFTNANIPRALPAKELEQIAATFNLHGQSFETVPDALNEAKKNAKDDDLIFIGGSTFVVAEVV